MGAHQHYLQQKYQAWKIPHSRLPAYHQFSCADIQQNSVRM
uniref:Uncharacterized protein n=1 Tax=Arundo donax TaxID=35708 RepID=A0A0A9GT58_ARUDO